MRRYLGEAIRYAVILLILLPVMFVGKNFGCALVDSDYRYAGPALPQGSRMVYDRRCGVDRLRRHDLLVFQALDLQRGRGGNHFFRLVAKPGERVRIEKEGKIAQVYVNGQLLLEVEPGAKPLGQVESFIVPLDHVFVLHEKDNRKSAKLRDFVLPIHLIVGRMILQL